MLFVLSPIFVADTKIISVYNFVLPLIEGNVRNISFKNYAENEAGRLVPDLFLFFKNALFKVKTSGHDLSFNILW